MINLLRKVVAGPKNRTTWEQYDFDLTYITDRIIAMAFPASGIEQTYRNSIIDIAKYLQVKHPAYLIMNASNRKYDYEVFNNRVKDYFWPDHQSPPFSTLFEICLEMFQFLQKQKDSVVCVHCNHGKGRTGTAIMSFIMYVGFFTSAKQVLKFYNKRRFSDNNYGISQPCQLRYLGYVEHIRQMAKNKPYDLQDKLKVFQLAKIQAKNLTQDYYLTISLTRTGQVKYKKIQLNKGKLQIQNQFFVGDIFIELYKNKWNGAKRVSRMNVNLFFLQKQRDKNLNEFYILDLNGENAKVSKNHHKNFNISFSFSEFCQCHDIENEKCPCQKERKRENYFWKQVVSNAHKCIKIESLEACKILYFPQKIVKKEDAK